MFSLPLVQLVLLAILTACASGDPPGAAPAVGRGIHRVASLSIARAAHTATTLASGEVLVVGGMADGEASTASVELFDPTHDTVRELDRLATPRAGHTATRLGDGRVLVAGGYDGESLASLEVFEPATGRFRAAGSLVEGRSGHTATLLPDGRILLAGGVGRGWTFLRSAELYDPATGRSQAVGPMSVPRESHTATLLADGRVLIVGGHSGRRDAMQVYASAEIFTPGATGGGAGGAASAGRFEPAGALATARHKHDAVRLADGRVLVIGGADRAGHVHFSSTEIYSPAAGRFERGPEMSNGRYKIAGTSILLPDGDVLVSAGAPVAEIFDLERGTFSVVPGRFPAAFRFAAAAPLCEGDVVIAGGYTDGNENTDGIWRLGPP